jgi:hypothetical protein
MIIFILVTHIIIPNHYSPSVMGSGSAIGVGSEIGAEFSAGGGGVIVSVPVDISSATAGFSDVVFVGVIAGDVSEWVVLLDAVLVAGAGSGAELALLVCSLDGRVGLPLEDGLAVHFPSIERIAPFTILIQYGCPVLSS